MLAVVTVCRVQSSSLQAYKIEAALSFPLEPVVACKGVGLRLTAIMWKAVLQGRF